MPFPDNCLLEPFLMVYTFCNLLGLLESAIITDYNERNKFLTAILLQQGYEYW